MAFDGVRFGVAAAGDKRQASVLYVRSGAVAEQVPLWTQPDGGEVGFGPVEGIDVVVDSGGQATGLMCAVATRNRAAIAVVAGGTLRGEAAAAKINLGVVAIGLIGLAVGIGSQLALRHRQHAGKGLIDLANNAQARAGVADRVERILRGGARVADKIPQRSQSGALERVLRIRQPLLLRCVRPPLLVTRHTAVGGGHQPVTRAASPGADGLVVLEIVPAVRNPEDGRVVDVAVERDCFLRMATVRRGGWIRIPGPENAWYLSCVLRVDDRSARQYTDIRVEPVVGLRCIFQVEAVTHGQIAEITRDRYPLRRVQYHPARHRIPDRAVFDERNRRACRTGGLRRLARHVEVDGVVHDASALTE